MKIATIRFIPRVIWLLLLFFHLAFASEKLPDQLTGAGVTEHLGSQLPLDLTFRNEQGRTVTLQSIFDGKKPVALLLVYYGCPNLCGFFLNGVLESFKKFSWVPGREFEVVTISIHPKETPELASQKKEKILSAYGRSDAKWNFWVNDVEKNPLQDATHVATLAQAAGFGYKYDPDQDEYAHAPVMIFLTPQGKISRYLYGIEFQPKDLKLALTEAGGGKIGNVVDRILLYCYNYNPKTKKYSLYAINLMKAGGGLTVALLVASLGLNYRRNRKYFGNKQK